MKDFDLSLKLIEKLIDVAKKKEIAKLKVSSKDFTVSIDLQSTVGFAPVAQTVPYEVFAKPKEQPKEEQNETEFLQGKIVTSPIVGTFYSSPAPDKPPFVRVGDRVKKGDVLFIIESMKLMNEIKSEFDGVVSKILVEAGDGVEYDQPIMILE